MTTSDQRTAPDPSLGGTREDEVAEPERVAGPRDQGPGADAHPEPDADQDQDRARLIPQERTEEYTARWDALKGGFVDEPRQAVAEADQLVRELLNELHETFRTQREGLEQGLDADQTSTEDLRVALRRYRSLFDRLLSI